MYTRTTGKKSTASNSAAENAPAGVRQTTTTVQTKPAINCHNPVTQREAIAQLLSGKFLVDDGEPVGEGQILKSNFISSLRAEAQQAAKAILAPLGLARANCPDLDYWINFYQGKDARYFENAIAKYAPGTADAKTYTEYLAQLVMRIRQGLEEHVATGSTEVEPNEAPKEISDKRPAFSQLPVQRKKAPVQFELGNKSTVSGGAKASGGGAARVESITVGTIKARADALTELYENGQGEEIARVLYESVLQHDAGIEEDLKLTVTDDDASTFEKFKTTYLSYCTGVGHAMALHVTGKSFYKRGEKGVQKETVQILKAKESSGPVSRDVDEKSAPEYEFSPTFRSLLAQERGLYHISPTDSAHNFILTQVGTVYSIYESDKNLTDQNKNSLHGLPGLNRHATKKTESGVFGSETEVVRRLIAIFKRAGKGETVTGEISFAV